MQYPLSTQFYQHLKSLLTHVVFITLQVLSITIYFSECINKSMSLVLILRLYLIKGIRYDLKTRAKLPPLSTNPFSFAT